MIETNLGRVNASANLQGRIKSNTSLNLYNTPLRELFEEAMKKAYEQYKKTRPELEASKDGKENAQNTAILHAQGEKFDLMSEKIKEAIRQKFEQGVENGANSALNSAVANGENSNFALNSSVENQNGANLNSTLNSAALNSNLTATNGANSNFALNLSVENQNSTNPTQANARNSSIERLKMLLGAIWWAFRK